jgi:hypothetical protein
MLTVPEEYAGQLMKCPLCSATFTVPTLPQSAALPPTPAPSSGSAGYGLAQEPPAPSPSPAGPATAPAATDLPEPDDLQPAGPPPPPGTAARIRSFSIPLHSKVVPWVAVGALFLVFVLTFFTWVGVYAGGIPLYTQGAWGAAFGVVTESAPAAGTRAHFPTYSPLPSAVTFNPESKDAPKEEKPGFSFLLFGYLFLLVVSLVLAVAAAVWPLLYLKLPPAVEQVRPWRWVIVAGLTLLCFVLLALQAVWSFNLETAVRNYLAKAAEADKSRRMSPDTDERVGLSDEALTLRLDRDEAMIRRTIWFRLALFLQLLAPAAAGLAFWLEQRGSEPEPRLEVHW